MLAEMLLLLKRSLILNLVRISRLRLRGFWLDLASVMTTTISHPKFRALRQYPGWRHPLPWTTAGHPAPPQNTRAGSSFRRHFQGLVDVVEQRIQLAEVSGFGVGAHAQNKMVQVP